MERTAWTDARLDDFQRNVDARFDRLEQSLSDFRGEVHLEFRAMRGEFQAMRNITIWVGATVGGAILAGLLGVIATLLSQG